MKLLSKLTSGISRQLFKSQYELMPLLARRAMEGSCSFIEENSDHLTNYYVDHWQMRKDVFSCAPQNGMFLEFGVNRGRSANFFAGLMEENNDQRNYYGFDTFTGLTEDWGGMSAPAGTFNRDGLPPNLHPKVKLVHGDILETLVPFLQTNEDKVAFIHIDTDTYTPCSHILSFSKTRLVNGSIILFDELIGYPNYHSHEFKALHEELPRGSYRFLSFGIAHPRANLIKSAIQIVDDSLFK